MANPFGTADMAAGYASHRPPVHPRVIKGEGHQAVVRQFVDVIRSGDWSTHIGSQGLTRTRVIDACYTSALQGREVLLSSDVARVDAEPMQR